MKQDCRVCRHKNNVNLSPRRRSRLPMLCRCCESRLRRAGQLSDDTQYMPLGFFCAHCGVEQPYVALCSDCGKYVYGYRVACSQAANPRRFLKFLSLDWLRRSAPRLRFLR